MYWLVIILAVILVIWLCKRSSSGRVICTNSHCVEGFSEASSCPPGQEMICSNQLNSCWCAYKCDTKKATRRGKCPDGYSTDRRCYYQGGPCICHKCPVKGKWI